MKLPSGWNDAVEQTPIEQQAQEAIFDATGAVVEPVFDGKIHRFKVDSDKGGEKSGWYVLFGDSLPAGAFGNWKDSDEGTRWCASGINTEANRAELEEQWRKIRETREAAQKKSWNEAAKICRQIWDAAPEATANHPYLERKKVKNHGLRVTGDGRLIMPIYVGAELTSLQYIDADGGKMYHSGGRTGGGYFRIPADNPAAGTRFIAEGYATAASIHEATGCETWVALSAGNLKKVGRFLREHMPNDDLCFVGDNDKSGTGQKAAKEAAEEIKGRAIIIPEPGDANDYAASGHDLKGLLLGAARHWIVPMSEFCKQPSPVAWLIKNWIQAEAQVMVFGAPGCGKTFVTLDMALSIACSKIETWNGHKVRHGPVVYLAGEGHKGLRARAAGWIAQHGMSAEDVGQMFFSEEARDLNTAEGLMDTIQEIRAWNTKPSLIVVDTLNRFMSGDENKAQDTKTMLDACAALYREFGCTVQFVHHTGVAQDAQNRARGSSAWRGAMDIEIAVAKEDNIVTLKQTKNKDAELQKDLKLEQVTVDVPGWFDEDGEQVTTCVMRLSGDVEVSEEKALTINQQTAVYAYLDAAQINGRLDENGKYAGLEREDWRKAFYARRPDDNAETKRKSFQRAVKDLIELEWFGETETDGVYIPIGLWSLWENKYLATRLSKNTDGTSGT